MKHLFTVLIMIGGLVSCLGIAVFVAWLVGVLKEKNNKIGMVASAIFNIIGLLIVFLLIAIVLVGAYIDIYNTL